MKYVTSLIATLILAGSVLAETETRTPAQPVSLRTRIQANRAARGKQPIFQRQPTRAPEEEVQTVTRERRVERSRMSNRRGAAPTASSARAAFEAHVAQCPQCSGDPDQTLCVEGFRLLQASLKGKRQPPTSDQPAAPPKTPEEKAEAPKDAKPAVTAPASKDSTGLSADESRMVAGINQFRDKHKLPAYAVDPILMRVARERINGARMDHNHPRYGYSPSHAVRDGFRAAMDGSLPMVSDNLAFGAGSPEQAEIARETSHVGHKDNLLGTWEAKHDGLMNRVDDAFDCVGVATNGRNHIAVFGKREGVKQVSVSKKLTPCNCAETGQCTCGDDCQCPHCPIHHAKPQDSASSRTLNRRFDREHWEGANEYLDSFLCWLTGCVYG